MMDIHDLPGEATMATTRAPADHGVGAQAQELGLYTAGAGVLALGWAYIRRLVRNDDARQTAVELELAQHRLTLRKCEAQHAACEASLALIETDLAEAKADLGAIRAHIQSQQQIS